MYVSIQAMWRVLLISSHQSSPKLARYQGYHVIPSTPRKNHQPGVLLAILLINCYFNLLDFFFPLVLASVFCFFFSKAVTKWEDFDLQASQKTNGKWSDKEMLPGSHHSCILTACRLWCFSSPYAEWKQFDSWNWRISRDVLAAQQQSAPTVPLPGLQALALIPWSSSCRECGIMQNPTLARIYAWLWRTHSAPLHNHL